MVSAPTRATSNPYQRPGQPTNRSHVYNRRQSIPEDWNKVTHQSFWQTVGYVSGKMRQFLNTLLAPEAPKPGLRLPSELAKASIAEASVQSQPITDNWPMGRLTTEQVFGPDPSKITFRQQNGKSCYLLAALDNILHHPQRKAILDKIGFEKTPNGYIVNFPGQEDPIFIKPSEIRQNGVQCDNLGIRLLETAYFKIPGSQWGEYDSTNLALCRMFGEHQVVSNEHLVGEMTLQEGGNAIVNSFQLAARLTTHADMWTATRRLKNTDTKTADKQPFKAGAHCYSIRPVPPIPGKPQQVQIVNPFNTSTAVETLTIDELNEKFNTEMNRLLL